MNKKSFIIIGLVLVIVAELLLIGYTFFIRFRKFTITFDTDGGNVIESISVQVNNEFEFPETPVKDGYTFIGWMNESDRLLSEEPVVTSNMTLKARWLKTGSKTVTIKVDNGNDEVININVNKGDKIIIPADLEREGYKFGGYVDKNGKPLLTSQTVDKNITIKAVWIENNISAYKLTFEDDGKNLGSFLFKNADKIILPANPTKAGYVFSGWVDEYGNTYDKETIIYSDIVLMPVWTKAYSCPDNCTPNEDGKTCTKILTKELTNTSGCPSGYDLVNNQCLDIKNQYPAENYQDSNGEWKWKCSSSSDYMYEEIEGLGAVVWCAKKTSKTTVNGCPSGYTKDGNICIKKETIKCTKNK